MLISDGSHRLFFTFFKTFLTNLKSDLNLYGWCNWIENLLLVFMGTDENNFQLETQNKWDLYSYPTRDEDTCETTLYKYLKHVNKFQDDD